MTLPAESVDTVADPAAPQGGSPAVTPIAIIGIGCRFPGGIDGPGSFWNLIASGTDAIGDIPADRWSSGDFFDPDPATPGRTFVEQGGFLAGPIDEFDARFFGMSPRDAAALDPQQRVLLEVTWEAFEDAGIPLNSTAGADIGTYIGGFTFDAASLQLADANQHLLGTSTPAGVSMTMLSARLPYTFDWNGPCFTLDTACSSSLVAFHQACVALERGECEMAVAGGVNVMFHPVATIVMSKGQFLSPDARCKPFDHRANGYVRSEGAGIVVLKPLPAAERDGDHIYAVVRGTAVNHDGRTPGTAVPSVDAQRALIRQAYRTAGIEPDSVGYYEAHGTGTPVGDPIEATAIGDSIGDSDRTHWIGSVKSNIGHTEAAAGVAGVIKASLCLERGLIPPTLHFQRPNPNIPFDRLPLRVATETVPFPRYSELRRAAVNSFGAGGTNAHAILEQARPQLRASRAGEQSRTGTEAPWENRQVRTGPTAGSEEGRPQTGTEAGHQDGRPQLLALSARSPEALRALADAYAGLLEAPDAPDFARICRAAARQRDHHPMRSFVVADGAADAARQLRLLEVTAQRAGRPSIAFVYTGMGPQWWGMGRELSQDEPVFAEVVAACDEVLARFGLSMAQEFRRDEPESRLTRTLYAQVANFVVQAGLTALWREWGIEPAVIAGHSVGEVAAAYAAGVYTLEDALTISFHRANLQARLAGRGAMAAVALSAAEVTPHLVDGAEVAAINGATAITLAGDPDAVELVSERLRATGARVTALRVEVAYHSAQMDEIRAPLVAALAGIRPRPARIPLVSTVTGGPIEGSHLDADYWWSNVRRPVRFADAIRRMLDHAPSAVLEVGPHPVLAPAMDEALAAYPREVALLASLHRDRPPRAHLLTTLGALYCAGAEPDWARVHPGPREHLGLPRYPWQRERHWIESATSQRTRLGAGGLALGGRPVAATTPVADIELAPVKFGYLADHRIGEDLIFPGAGYVEAALAMFADDTPCFLEDIVFHRPLVLAPSVITTLRAGYDPARRQLRLHATTQPDEPVWTLQTGLRRAYLAAPPIPAPRAETLADATADLPSIDHDQVYEILGVGNLNYGKTFRAVDELWYRRETGEVFAEIRTATIDTAGYRLHPVLLDAALQSVFAGALLLGGADAAGTYVPARITELRFYRRPGRQLWVHGRDRHSTMPGRFDCDLTLITDDGEIVAEVIGLRAQRVAADSDARPSHAERLYYDHAWQATELDPTGDLAGSWILIGSDRITTELHQRLTDSGAAVTRVTPQARHWLAQVTTALAADAACRGVVYVQDTKTATGPVCTPITEPLRLIQALPAAGVSLFLVTSGTQSIDAGDVITDPFAGALWGFARVVNAERPELRCRLIDLDAENPDLDALAGELAHDGLDEVALRGGTRHIRRIEPAGDRSPAHQLGVTTDRTPVRLGIHRTTVDSLRFAATTRRAPGPTEVEIEVAYVGVNFKDVLKVTGLITPQAIEGSHSGEALGLECSGTVIRVGSQVTELRPGDEVFAHSRGLFASHLTLDAVRVARKPAALSLAEAASLLPVVTAHQALVRLAGVRTGDRVLIHSAAGGVGLAAVRIATALGAQVYATAGSRARRDFLRTEGVAHVADSRSTSFADEILAWTGGAGVDVIVNSLPGDMLHASLRVLRTFGRFVELGKPADTGDDGIRTHSVLRAMSYHSFDYDQMMALEPEYVQTCMKETAELFEQSIITALPVTEIPAESVDKAFLAMGGPEHLGKIVVRMSGERVTVPAASLPQSPLRPDATYLLTGGLGGLGRTVAQRFAERGARHLVLAGRHGAASEEAARTVAELTAGGVTVRVEQADVADRSQVAELLKRVRADMPPIRGIIHAAADFDDIVLSETDPGRLLDATRPKADGAWNLHLESEPDDLDFLVFFSSVGAQLGSVGLGAYATANEFLDALARYRHGLGLPATSVGWGMIDEVGVAVSGNGEVGAYLRRSGHIGLSPETFAAELETLLRTRPVEVSVADIDWPRWARANPQLSALPRFHSVAPADTADAGPGLASLRLHEADPGERAALLAPLLTPLLAQTTGLTEHQLGDDQPIDIDSLTAVGLRVLLQKELGVSVPAVKLQTNLTMTGLAGLLAEELAQAPLDTFVPERDLTVHEFEAVDGLTVYGHLAVPAGPGPHPAVLICTAGPGGALAVSGDYAQIAEHAPLHEAGFATFTVDHRGAPGHGAEFTDRAEMGGREIDDILTAARYLAQRPEIDPGRISIAGTSRGAYSALLALARNEFRWHRAALLMGLYSPEPLVTAERAHPGSFLPPHAGISPDDIAEHFAHPQRQPLTMLDAVSAPLLVVHGDADDMIPAVHARDLTTRAQQAGLPARLHIVPGLAHDSAFTDPAWTDLWPEIIAFLQE
ncbi:SDR family NAD(P)-dependent oxidoreductase [Nocardia sp. NPDC088792]|uniref:SDR family NAD(P)-dependent oxidoreductase n=1 Tax=Nocardia sp. NPDC088792 TaxID=3364332 RepID=UPI0037FE3FBE